jgi:spoIIIJ-associated protein
VQEVADHLKTFLGGLTEAFGLDGDVVIDESEPDVLVATVDAQHGLMVGPKGRTLDAIQELARVSAQRTTPSSIRIKIDVGGYRRQRAEALEAFARKAADKAVDNAIEIALDPMSPADRKVIHDALSTDSRVETRSVGNEPYRKVLVVPVSSGDSSDGGSDEEE